MSIEVQCTCGKRAKVSDEFAGRKIKCKECGSGVRVPAPNQPEPEPEPEPEPISVEEFEIVSERTVTRTCPSCGATAAPTDTACLTCGGELGSGGALEAIPRPVLLGLAALLLIGLLAFGGSRLSHSMAPSRHTGDGNALLADARKAKDSERVTLLKSAQAEFQKALKAERSYAPAMQGMAMIGLELDDSALLKSYGPKALETLTDKPDKARLRIALAWVLLGEEKHREANNLAVEAANDDESVLGVNAIRGLAALRMDPPQKEKALTSLQKAVNNKVKRVEVYSELAKLYREKKEAEKAHTVGEAMIKLEQEQAELWLLLAQLRAEVKDRPGTAKALQRVIKLDPKNTAALSRLSQIYLIDKKLELALKSAQEASKVDPANLEARLAVGRILLAMEKPTMAQAELKEARKLGESWEADYLLGTSQVQTGEVQAGWARIQAALATRPEDVKRHLEAAEVLLEAKQGVLAMQLLQALVQNQPKHYGVRVLLAKAMAGQANGAYAYGAQIEVHLKEALKLKPRRREAPLALGDFYDEKGDAKQAFTAYSAGTRFNAEDAELLFKRGSAALDLKDWDAAIESFKACRAANADYPEVAHRLKDAQQGKFFATHKEE